MDKKKIVDLLYDLNSGKSTDTEVQLTTILTLLNTSDIDIFNETPTISDLLPYRNNYECKFLCLNFHLLHLLNKELSKSQTEVLSLQEIQRVKNSLKNLLHVGILTRIQPNLPHYANDKTTNQNDVVYNYNLLKFTTCGFIEHIKNTEMRMLILPEALQGILVAIYQIAFSPLKKPIPSNHQQDTFRMTQEFYEVLVKDQITFRGVLMDDLRPRIPASIFVKHTMALFRGTSPVWLKKAVSSTLTAIIRSETGVRDITLAMLDGSDNDTKSWAVLEVLTKLIIGCRKFPDFEGNICGQVIDLLDSLGGRDELLTFERLTTTCTRALYLEDTNLCTALFIRRVFSPLVHLADTKHKFRDGAEITEGIQQSARLLYGAFFDEAVTFPTVPINLLKPLINVVFHLYDALTVKYLKATSQELKNILTQYLHSCGSHELNQLFGVFLGFDTNDEILKIRGDITLEVDAKIIVKNRSSTQNVSVAADSLLALLHTKQKIVLFGYLLTCITIKDDFLRLEDETPSAVLEKLLTTQKLLAQLSEDPNVLASLRQDPDEIIGYIGNVFAHSIQPDLKSSSDGHQALFITMMILDNLVGNASRESRVKYEVLRDALGEISKTEDAELRGFCVKILRGLGGGGNVEDVECGGEMSEVDKALQEVGDPLLPVRGHGLLVLAKLVEKKDVDAMERKQYLLNIFQLSLKDEDSFIYLNAVKGLTALAEAFPDTVLEVLCEEFADFSRKTNQDDHEVRMKLGEVLVRVTKLLGKSAPKYKALLLNTFLAGTKDDDHLIRASSLSNLGEVCQVLGYQLGTIVAEVLNCIKDVITTDKAVEARRAAVTVIRQLFVGLESEMISFLKEDILQIYRTLKEIYYNDQDDVMRLQAQLALEELNENMKSFVFPSAKLETKNAALK